MRFWVTLMCLIAASSAFAGAEKCKGAFINPITDVDWMALFPIHIAGAKIADPSPEGLTPDPFSSPLCACGNPVPRIGIPIGFWQPFRAADVTRKPYCMVNLGGMNLNLGLPTPKGDITNNSTSDLGRNQQTAFYHVHWYVYPLLSWMNFLTDILCLEHEDFDVAYLTELDPTWADDEIGMWLTPESAIFANPLAQTACIADCAASTFGKSLLMPHCAGCQGGVYPVTGTLPFHQSGADASTLMVERMLFKLHREGLLWGSIGKEGICHKYPLPWWRKNQYKLQPVYPSVNKIPGLKTNPIGRTTFVWSIGKDLDPLNGDWGYLIWRRKECCVW